MSSILQIILSYLSSFNIIPLPPFLIHIVLINKNTVSYQIKLNHTYLIDQTVILFKTVMQDEKIENNYFISVTFPNS